MNFCKNFNNCSRSFFYYYFWRHKPER